MLPSDFTLHNRYRIIYNVDERPGMKIYRGRDEQTGRLMLIAALPSGDAGGEDVELLARQVASVHHEAILPVVDQFGEGGSYYLVCEDINGQDLERTLRARGGPMPEAQVLAQARRLLDGIEHLHSQRPPLYLGDPLPSDLWIGEDGAWRLAPFTLVRPIGHTSSPYRAPELAASEAEPTPASDLYALVALLYQALTGWAPPTAEQQQAGTPLNGPRSLNPSLSPLMEQALLRGLQQRPSNRYQVAREMRVALEMVQMMDGRSLGLGPDITPPSQQAQPPAPPAPQPPTPQPPSIYPAPQPVQPQPAQTQAYPPGIYPAPQAGAPAPAGYAQPPMQPYPHGVYQAPQPRRGLSTGCLVVIAIVLTLAAVAVCAALAWFIPGSPLPTLLGARAALAPTNPAAAAPTAAPPTAAAAAAPSRAPLPTLQPSNLGPRAITLQNVNQITETHEITGAVLGPVAYSPDGKTLAVGVSNVISLRAAESLEEFDPPRRLEGHTGAVFTLAWSPDSTLLASGAMDENIIRLWNMSDGKLARELKGHTGWIRAVAFAPDGKTLASGSIDQTVRLWDVATGTVIWTFTGHTDFIGTVAFTPDGKAVASSSSDGTVRLWDVITGQQRSEFSYKTPPSLTTNARLRATGLAFAKDGKSAAIGLEDGSVALVDAATGTLQRTLSGHQDIVVSRGLQFSPDGKTLASASFDGTIRLWDVASGAETAVLSHHVLRVLSLGFSPDGAHLASTSDAGGQLLVWDVKQPQADPLVFRVGQGLVTWMTFSPNGSILGTVGYNGTAHLHQVDQDRYRTLFGTAAATKALAFLDDQRVTSITDNGTVAVLGPQDVEAKELQGMDGKALNVVASADGTLIAAGSTTGAIGRWDSASGTAKPALQSEQLKSIAALAMSADGGLIAAGGPSDDPRIEIWDTSTGRVRTTLSGAASPIITMMFQPRGEQIAATSLDGKLRIWNTQDGSLVRTIGATPEQRLFSSMTFSPDGSLIATGSPNGDIVFWNAQTGEQATQLPPRAFGIFSLAMSPDGRRLAAGVGDETIRLYELGKN